MICLCSRCDSKILLKTFRLFGISKLCDTDEPSTMSDAVKFMIGDYNDTVIVGMPDTYILNAPVNIYKEMMKETNADLVL